ncbi:MAG: acyl carrier protein [Lachnospiraceae bacterium]|nr:acyl carrier protein [Lachnospiraceae bacterium]
MEFETLVKVIAEIMNVDPAEVTEDTTFVDDLGADSLDLFQIIMGVQEQLDIEDSDEFDEAMGKVVTVGDAVELLKKAR